MLPTRAAARIAAMTRPIAIAGALGSMNALYRAAARPRLARLGATDAEARRPLPGDDVLLVGADTSTMATTIDAPPADVWPWLVQMGFGRAGWYSYDRLDNGGRPSGQRGGVRGE